MFDMSIESIIKPKRPAGLGWTRARWWQPPAALRALDYPCEAWEHRGAGLFVLSALEVAATESGGEDLGPEFHVSVSAYGERCTSAEATWVLQEFGLIDATEDNHVPHGEVRNFWRPVADRFSGYECPCVGDEAAIREDQGDYVWRR